MTRILRRQLPLAFLAAVAVLGISIAAVTAVAQTPSTLLAGQAATDGAPSDAATLQSLAEKARAEGYQIILVPPGSPGGDGTGARAPADLMAQTAMMEQRIQRARDRLVQVLRSLPALPEHVAEVVVGAAEDAGTPWWPVLAIGLAAIFLVIGWLTARRLDVWFYNHFHYLYRPDPSSRAERLTYLLVRVMMRSVIVLVQIVVAGLLTVVLAPDSIAWRSTILLSVLAFAVARVMVLVLDGIIAPDAPSHRLIWLGDETAAGLFRSFSAVTWIAATVVAICLLMDRLGIDRGAHHLLLIGATLVVALLFSALTIIYRRDVASALLGARPEKHGRPVRDLAGIWHVFATLYFFGAWAVSVVRLLLEEPGALGLVMAPVLLGVAALSIYAVAILIIDRFFERRATLAIPTDGSESDQNDVAPEKWSGGDGAVQGVEPPLAEAPAMVITRRRGLKELAEHSVALFLTAAYLLLLFDTWFSVSARAEATLQMVTEIALIGFIAYIAFHVVRIKLDDLIAAEGGPIMAAPGEEGGAAGKASRLATLLPIFRNFLLAVIAAIAGMVVLSELGLDIAPLFAGAGVVGLAVGFGAQTLIRDIFSGFFFLLDDAFRMGEYIEIGTTRCTVERISIRSMQLRHQLGRLHTIPFGEITSLTNYSRDWVMMKLPLRLTYDTDPEKVRKLIKKLGTELLSHPEIGDKFMEPLKSQGVYMMEDSAMIVRVKFMTRPGDQFVARKVVYASIRELFERNGIKFANREVTVRLADAPDRPLTEDERKEVAGAVRPLIDEAAGEAGGGAAADAR